MSRFLDPDTRMKHKEPLEEPDFAYACYKCGKWITGEYYIRLAEDLEKATLYWCVEHGDKDETNPR